MSLRILMPSLSDLRHGPNFPPILIYSNSSKPLEAFIIKINALIIIEKYFN